MKFFKRKKPKQEVKEMATADEKEIKKAELDIDDKGKDTQTRRDREDESVAAQERDKGDEDSQTAKDRIDESRGTKRADEERDKNVDSDSKEHRDAKEDARQIEEHMRPILEELKNLNARIDSLERKPSKASDSEADKLKELERKFVN